MSVTIIIASYGDKGHWDRVSMPALLSAEDQTRPAEEIIRYHGSSLHEARNSAAMAAKTEWLCFLDADDQLDPKYIEAMLASTGDLRWPRVIKKRDNICDNYWTEYHRHESILQANHMVIGTLVRRRQFLKVRGFRDLPIYEDWDLWIRCKMDGATDIVAQNAYYIASDLPDSRNKAPNEMHLLMADQFRREYAGNL